MRWWGSWFPFVSLALASGLPAQTCAGIVAEAEALGARTGVAFCDDSGRVLYGHRVGAPFTPASNLKILTAAAVLDGLGPDFTFVTRFRLRGGRLVVDASGDPNWIHDTEHAAARVFAALAAALRRDGVTALAGIELDPGCFHGPARPPGWPQDQLHTYYCAPTGPFVLEQGTFVLAIDGGDGGPAAAVDLVAPAAGLPIRGSIDLVEGKRRKNAVYGALDLGDAITVRGAFVRKSPPVTIRTAVRDPAAWYESALRRALGEHGIAIGGAVPAAGGDRVVFEHRSPLRPAVERMLADSSNFDAEQCLRVLGAHTRGDGSLAGGLAAMRERLERRLGVVPDGVELTDGSGLSRDNRVTAGLLAAALLASAGTPGGDVLHDSLAVAGRSGTLSDRFTGTQLAGRVRGKTGWIRGASALSGVLEGRDGTRRYFAILMNYEPRRAGLNKDLKALQERLVAAFDALVAER